MIKPNALRVLAVIPVYHETGRIGSVISEFEGSYVDEVCVVLDCPSDAILNEIEHASERIDVRVHIVQNQERRGIGHAIRQGIRYGIRGGFDALVVMAGNGKDDPREIPKLLKPILEDGYDYVQGSRFLPGARRVRNPILRGVFSRLYPFVWTLLTDVRCTDVTNGFRAYRTRIFDDKRVNIWQRWLDGYGLEYYVHYKALTLGYRAEEVPVSKVYPYRHRGGYSKIQPLRDWWQILGCLIYLKLGARE